VLILQNLITYGTCFLGIEFVFSWIEILFEFSLKKIIFLALDIQDKCSIVQQTFLFLLQKSTLHPDNSPSSLCIDTNPSTVSVIKMSTFWTISTRSPLFTTSTGSIHNNIKPDRIFILCLYDSNNNNNRNSNNSNNINNNI